MRVVLVGDRVNKGPRSAECVRFVRTSGFACVRGNHDDAALFAWERRQAERRRDTPAKGGKRDPPKQNNKQDENRTQHNKTETSKFAQALLKTQNHITENNATNMHKGCS